MRMRHAPYGASDRINDGEDFREGPIGRLIGCAGRAGLSARAG